MTSIKKTLFAGVIITGLISLIFSGSSAGDKKTTTNASDDSSKAAPGKRATLPKLIDLGSKSCIPCKKMAPILEEMKTEYKGKAEVIFIDTKEDRDSALKYKITLIPTQIFFDTSGIEVYRHIGFFPADSIKAHFKALGIEL
ncbi:MAG TPA: thioredoxin [candidate division Zixibacteria bacterium]|jgi:thioredoxin 1|nr:thioredoxin [candidate division Zixibacteria bacterium]